MKLAREDWAPVLRLLDAALELPPERRDDWLSGLPADAAAYRAPLVQLLADRRAIETNDFLQSAARLADAGRAEFGAGRVMGPYRLTRKLGHGGMAEVWLAERADAAHRRSVALKLPRVEVQPRVIAARFARERDILSTLTHPQIASVLDAGIDGAQPWLAMEFVDGQPITGYCDAQRLDIAARLRLFLQVLRAVQHAHARLVIHRDIKPSNVMVDAAGSVKLLDFGVAKLLEAEGGAAETALTQWGGRAMTPQYASPEQVAGGVLGTATDVYSLGVLLYQLLVGRLPYVLSRDSAAALEEAILAAQITPPSQAVSERARSRTLRGDIDTIVLKALQTAPAERYASAEAFAQDIERHLQSQPILARPASAGYKLRKLLSRHRITFAAGAAVACALVAGTGVALWQAERAREQATRANEVKQFMLSIFEDADTTLGAGRKTTAADLLRQAYARLTKEPVSDAVTRVELLTVIGASLVGQGEYAQSIPVLEEAAHLALTTLGVDHADTANAQLILGESLQALGRGKEAVAQLDASAIGMQRNGNIAGEVHSLRFKAFVRAREAHYDESVALAAEAVRLAEEHLVASDKRTVMLANFGLADTMNLARREGRLAPARRAYALAREIYGDRLNGDSMAIRSLYAYSLVLEGELQHGLLELKSLLDHQIELLGPDHADVGSTHGRISSTLMWLGEPLAAVDSLRSTIRINLANLGDGKPNSDTGKMQMALGLALANARHYEDADRELVRAIEILAPHSDENGFNARLALGARAFVLTNAGRLGEADAIFARLQERPGGGPREQATNDLRLGRLRSIQGRHDEALSLIRGATEYFGKASTGTDRATALAALGHAQIAATGAHGLAEQALATLSQAAALLESRQPHLSPERADVHVGLARAHLALGHADEAVASATQAADFWKTFDNGSHVDATALLWQARALTAAKRPQEAAVALGQARGLLAASKLPADHVLLAQAQRELAGLTTAGQR